MTSTQKNLNSIQTIINIRMHVSVGTQKAEEQKIDIPETIDINKPIRKRGGLIQPLAESVVKQSGEEYNVSLIANYIYDLARSIISSITITLYLKKRTAHT